MSNLFYTFDWSIVRAEAGRFILPDAVVSCRDAAPRIPETGAAPMSSPQAETFVPIDPVVGLLLRPTEKTFSLGREAEEVLRGDSPERMFEVLAGREGANREVHADARQVDSLNLLSYAYAHRHVYGHQQDVVAVHAAARRSPAKVEALRPLPPRMHILEDDPTRPGVLLETDTIIADDPRSR